jgi:hypothetical protein
MLVGVLGDRTRTAVDEEHILCLFSSAELQASHTLVPNKQNFFATHEFSSPMNGFCMVFNLKEK